MGTLELVETISAAVAAFGTLCGGGWFLWRLRRLAIERKFTLLPRRWTNEGDISSTEPMIIELKLKNQDGDLIGTLRSPQLEKEYDVSVSPGWFSSTMLVIELCRREAVTKAKVKLVLAGNQNRLKWKTKRNHLSPILLRHTLLWPMIIQPAEYWEPEAEDSDRIFPLPND